VFERYLQIDRASDSAEPRVGSAAQFGERRDTLDEQAAYTRLCSSREYVA